MCQHNAISISPRPLPFYIYVCLFYLINKDDETSKEKIYSIKFADFKKKKKKGWQKDDI
jgi:hypothetical protein